MAAATEPGRSTPGTAASRGDAVTGSTSADRMCSASRIGLSGAGPCRGEDGLLGLRVNPGPVACLCLWRRSGWLGEVEERPGGGRRLVRQVGREGPWPLTNRSPCRCLEFRHPWPRWKGPPRLEPAGIVNCAALEGLDGDVRAEETCSVSGARVRGHALRVNVLSGRTLVTTMMSPPGPAGQLDLRRSRRRAGW
jgi:hypothetical protein